MRIRSILLALLLLVPLCSEAKDVKPKAPVVTPDELLKEALSAYHAYQFEQATTALEKYFTALQRKRLAIPDSAKELEAQVARAERMYASADALHVVDSALVRISQLSELLPQGGGRFYSELQLPDGLSSVATRYLHQSVDSASSSEFPLFAFVDALARNSIVPSGGSLTWLAKAGSAWERQEIEMKTLEGVSRYLSPFLLEDGMTLFFSTKTSSGLGGYDLYMTRLTEQGNSFFEPTLLGMPYNSPFNDYLLAYHEAEGWGILISDRFAPEGQVHVYRFTGRPAFLSGSKGGETSELAPDEAYRRATLSGVLYTDGEVLPRPTKGSRAKEELFFHLQGSTIYRYWSDFKTEAGRQAFESAETLRRDLLEQRARLERLRSSWGQARPEARPILRSEIQLLEAALTQKEAQLQSQLNAVRRHEGVH